MDAESSVELLERVRSGDQEALERLLRRYVPALRRWVSGRLPRWARDIADTEDLVQDTVIRSLPHLGTFEQRHEGALQGYLRRAVMNRLKDECRRMARRPRIDDLEQEIPDQDLSPLEAAIGREAVGRYEEALQQLPETDRQAIVARIEMGYSYEEMALMLERPTANAARAATCRAIVKLAAIMRHGR